MKTLEEKLIEGTATIKKSTLVEITGDGEKFFLHIDGVFAGEFYTYSDAAYEVIERVNNLM